MKQANDRGQRLLKVTRSEVLPGLRGNVVTFYWEKKNQRRLMEKFALSFTKRVDFRNTEEGNGRLAFQAEPTT